VIDIDGADFPVVDDEFKFVKDKVLFTDPEVLKIYSRVLFHKKKGDQRPKTPTAVI